MNKIRYSLDDIRGLVKKYENVKRTGSEMIHELKELILAKPEIIQLLEATEKRVSLRFFDLVFIVQVEINSAKIDSAIGILKVYLDLQELKEMQSLDIMEFTFDDSDNIQQKDELFILSLEVFPYYFLSKLTEFIINQRIVIKP
ncbi:hypothetical protein Q0590_13290 [Rhodocytophaga aerolata]|uniref:Uncharacterized protein n=1 Tax=Rhodocytophaga aerolata TaxID=455078 RepID=A0ABT8R7R9_9BACT|nr:hypothetical protein [Rhodocytophaga aerolata]MDO1447238.1 hypothetical protein [Rhodocytophaga aerolata]